MSKNSRTIRLSDKNRSVVLDVNPKNVTIAYPQKAERRELLGGEYIEMGKKGLRTATVETFLPGSSSPFKQGTMSAETTFQTIKKWKENGTAVGFSVSGVDSGTFYITSLMRTATEGGHRNFSHAGGETQAVGKAQHRQRGCDGRTE